MDTDSYGMEKTSGKLEKQAAIMCFPYISWNVSDEI